MSVLALVEVVVTGTGAGSIEEGASVVVVPSGVVVEEDDES